MKAQQANVIDQAFVQLYERLEKRKHLIAGEYMNKYDQGISKM